MCLQNLKLTKHNPEIPTSGDGYKVVIKFEKLKGVFSRYCLTHLFFHRWLEAQNFKKVNIITLDSNSYDFGAPSSKGRVPEGFHLFPHLREAKSWRINNHVTSPRGFIKYETKIIKVKYRSAVATGTTRFDGLQTIVAESILLTGFVK